LVKDGVLAYLLKAGDWSDTPARGPLFLPSPDNSSSMFVALFLRVQAQLHTYRMLTWSIAA
jgi:hypothetical protein